MSEQEAVRLATAEEISDLAQILGRKLELAAAEIEQWRKVVTQAGAVVWPDYCTGCPGYAGPVFAVPGVDDARSVQFFIRNHEDRQLDYEGRIPASILYGQQLDAINGRTGIRMATQEEVVEIARYIKADIPEYQGYWPEEASAEEIGGDLFGHGFVVLESPIPVYLQLWDGAPTYYSLYWQHNGKWSVAQGDEIPADLPGWEDVN